MQGRMDILLCTKHLLADGARVLKLSWSKLIVFRAAASPCTWVVSTASEELEIHPDISPAQACLSCWLQICNTIYGVNIHCVSVLGGRSVNAPFRVCYTTLWYASGRVSNV